MRVALSLFVLLSAPALAVENARVDRVDASQVTISWTEKDPVTIYVADHPSAPISRARIIAKDNRIGTVTVTADSKVRRYYLLKEDRNAKITRIAERELPLEKGSNFRDIGGYKGADGKSVKWGKIYRSGAMPMLSESDYTLLRGVGITSIVDLRSIEERQVAPTLLDDRTGALFIANDYSLKPLLANVSKQDGEYSYDGMGKLLAPQYRAIFRRLLADEGAVVYNCSAGQDRTGIASALVLSALGVDRKTIMEDYHLSTKLRRTQNEMPDVNPADYPGNFIVQYYMSARSKPGGGKPEPLYSPKGHAHLAQFFQLIDRDYGGVDGYLKTELGIGDVDLKKLKQFYLE